MKKLVEKPNLIKTVGWLWILTGSMLILIGLWAMFISLSFAEVTTLTPAETDQQSFLSFIISTVSLLPYVSIYFLLLGTCGIYVSLSFMKFKYWARSGLEIISWFGIATIIAVLYYWIEIWSYVYSSKMPSESYSFIEIAGLFVGLLAGGFYSVVLAAVIKNLRSQVIKAIFKMGLK